MPSYEWCIRFCLAWAAIALLSAIPLWMTWGAWQLDGTEYAGWPFSFWESGGFSSNTDFHLHWFFADLAVCWGLAILYANSGGGSVSAIIRYLRTWGTPQV